MRHVNIPVFIPHLGCPNNCVFCDQRKISGCVSFDESGVEKEIETALSTLSPDDEVEIAFFGGSFTGIDRSLMVSLLEIAEEFGYENESKFSAAFKRIMGDPPGVYRKEHAKVKII